MVYGPDLKIRVGANPDIPTLNMHPRRSDYVAVFKKLCTKLEYGVWLGRKPLETAGLNLAGRRASQSLAAQIGRLGKI